MHYWYTSSTLVEAPTSSFIGTCFVDLAYMHWFMVDVLAWYKWRYMLMYIFGTIIDGICLDDSTWIKVYHWYYLISTYFGT
jgi:hypothetical protein